MSPLFVEAEGRGRPAPADRLAKCAELELHHTLYGMSHDFEAWMDRFKDPQLRFLHDFMHARKWMCVTLATFVDHGDPVAYMQDLIEANEDFLQMMHEDHGPLE